MHVCLGSPLRRSSSRRIPGAVARFWRRWKVFCCSRTNPFTGDGTSHPDLHLIYVDEVCGLFKLASLPEDEVKKKVFPLSLKDKVLTCYKLCDATGSWDYNRLKLEFHQKFYPMHLVHRDRNYI